MLKKKVKQGLFLVILCTVCLLIPAAASANAPEDITQTGVNFMTEPPVETTVYTAGKGTVTYEPAQNGKSAVITLENAAINGRQNASYQLGSSASAAILMTGNVDLVLLGENQIMVLEKYTHGLFCFNGNLNVKGPGSLTIDILAALNGPSGIDILNGKGATEDMGNFTQTGGSITLKLSTEEHFSYCLSANKDVTIAEGSFSVENGSCSIVSIRDDIHIRNAAVSCKDFDDTGLYAFNGDVFVEGENTALTIAALKDGPYSIGIYSEGQAGSSAISISGGTVDVSVGQSGICTDGGGSIMVSGGKISAKAENTDAEINAVGLWATGKIDIMGGTVYASGSADTGVGIYSDTAITVSGGDVTAKGTVQAVSHVPDTEAYNNAVITASADFEGSNPEAFSAEKLESYRYLHIAPGNGEYAIRYEGGRAIINAPRKTEASVIFAAYDSTGRLTDLDVQKANLAEGETVITPEHFSPEAGKIKVMLWDSMGNFSPLCDAEIFEISV